jgi:ATP-binding cassette subfamily G (WHITE) protein 2 (SNQ2)
MQQTTFVSLYQAGEGIYQQFDKVLVLNESHVVYFGPSTEARQYMVGLGYKDLPRQTSADYLSGCTDPNERQFADGKDVDSVPSTPERMEEAYRQSDIYRRMMVEKDEYKKHMAEDERHREEFRQAVHEQKQKGVRTKSPYTAPFISQVWAITKRQTILKFQDKFGIYTGYGRPSSSLLSSVRSTSVSPRRPLVPSLAVVSSSWVFSSTSVHPRRSTDKSLSL